MSNTGTITGTIITQTVTLGVGPVSNYPTYTSPLTITSSGGVDTNSAADAIFGPNTQPWMVVNQGTLFSKYGIGVDLQAGGTVANNGGLIQGYADGVFMALNAGTVTNSGTISETKASGGAGVDLAAGGTVTNSGSIVAAYYAVELGASGTIINSGTIMSPGSASYTVLMAGGGYVTNSQSGYITGIEFLAGGTVVNAGRIVDAGGAGIYFRAGGSVDNTGFIDGSARGIFVKGSAGNVTNSGTITTTSAIRAGVELLAGGSVANNAGTGLIQGSISGVYITGAAGTVTNSGTISSTGTSGKDNGIFLAAGGTIVNSGTIIGTGVPVFGTPSASGGFGIDVQGAAGTVVNSGIITSMTAANYGVGLLAGGSVTNQVGGSISGGVYVTGGAGTVVNDGSINEPGNYYGVFLRAGGIVSNAGLIEGYGGVEGFGGTTLVTNSGTITGTVGFGITLGTGGTVIDSGTISGGNGTAVGFGGAGSNLLVLENGYQLSGGVSVAGISNTLELLGTTGAVTVDFDKPVAGFTQFGTAAFGAASGNDETLKITDTTALPGTISGFTLTGDIVDLTQLSPVGASATLNGSDQLVVSNGIQSVMLQLDTSENYSGVVWQTGTDSGSGTDVTVACYCRGTLIRTASGEVPVETLAIGDRVMTLSGDAKPIKWIGRRVYDGRFIAGNRAVLPIRVAAGAIADGVPARDLFLSPTHALYIDGVLAPAEYLVNGATIAQAESVDEVAYFHIELAAHDVIFADGAPAESYVDCNNRGMFQNAGEFAVLYPADDRDDRPAGQFCAARLEEDESALTAIRAQIDRRAGLPAAGSGSDQLPNPRMDGAAIGILGAGGALPTGWRTYSAANLSYGVVGSGWEDGIDYVDVRIFGTPSATTYGNQLFFAGAAEIPAGFGERWAVAADLRLCAGSLANVQAIQLAANLNDAGGQYSSWFRSTALAPLDNALAGRRISRSGMIADRNAAYLQPLLQIATTEGCAIDLTLRIGRPRAALLRRSGIQMTEAIGAACANFEVQAA